MLPEKRRVAFRVNFLLQLTFFSLSLPACGSALEWDIIPPNQASALNKELIEDTSSGRLLMVVAHPDDDLLFMSPSSLRDLALSHDIRVVYLTSGDDGSDPTYWQHRETGIQTAYAQAANAPNDWIADTYTAGPLQVARFTLNGRSADLSLVFVRLPDGNLTGQGFPRRGFESLRKLWQGTVAELHTVDTGTAVSRTDLIAALAVMETDYASRNVHESSALHTLNCQPVKTHTPDHVDHHFSAQFALAAYATTEGAQDLYLHHGYDSVDYAMNLEVDIAREKWKTFLTYAQFDRGMQMSNAKWLEHSLYLHMRQREYVDGTVPGPIEQDDADCVVPLDNDSIGSRQSL